MAGSLHLVATVPLSLKRVTLERGENCCGVVESTQGMVRSLWWVNGDSGVVPGVAYLPPRTLESRKVFAHVWNQGRHFQLFLKMSFGQLIWDRFQSRW